MKGPAFRVFFCALSLVASSTLHAVQVEDSAAYPGPPSGLPFSNFGHHGSSSAIFVGDIASNGTYWALTASHIAAGNFSFNGVTYYVPESERIVLDNKLGFGYPKTDLVLARLNISSLPAGLVNLSIAPFLPSETETTYIVGRGGNVRWATTYLNFATDDGFRLFGLDLGASTTVAYTTQTDRADPGLSQTDGWAVRFDSGGGHFFQRDDQWYLSGILLAINTEGSIEQSYTAALPYYRNDLLALAAIPEPGSLFLLALGALPLVRRQLRRRV